MLNQKMIDRHESNNARVAARVLANPSAYPRAMVIVAEICQSRQGAEKAQSGQPGYVVPSRPAAAQQRQQPAKPVRPMRPQQLPFEGVSHGAA
jgi:hypothetical protein